MMASASLLQGLEAQSGARLLLSGLQDMKEEAVREILKEQWGEISKRGLSPSRADDAAFFLATGLRQQGFAEAKVKAVIRNARDLELIIQEGPRYLLGDIEMIGVNGLDEKLLKEAMISEMRKRQSLLETDRDLPFVRSAILKGGSAIEGYAQHEGYLEATAQVSFQDPDGTKKQIPVQVSVREGPQYVFGSVTLKGVEGQLYRKLRKLGDPYIGKALNIANTRAIQGEGLRILNEIGYFDATVSLVEGLPDPSQTKPSAAVVIEIVAGEIYRVESVEVTGSQDLPDDFVEKRVSPLLGERYDPVEVRSIYKTLIRTGLYNNIEITPEPTSNQALKLKVTVDEANFRQVGLYGGFGSFDGYIIGTSYSNRNLFGTGRSFRSAIEVNGRGVQGELNYLDRWFLDSKWQFGANVFAGTREFDGYSKWELGARASFTYQTSEHTSFGLYAGFSYVSLTENHFVDVVVGPEDYQVQEIGAVFTWDHREDLEPTGHGYLFEISLDYATSFLVGDVSLLRSQMRLAHYWKLPGDSELRLGLRAGIMHPLGDTDTVPVDFRFFNGGSQSVRSFPERELGPQDRRHHPTGGQFYTIFNAEWVVPLKDAFSLAVFGDAGNLLEEASDAGLGDMHYAAGLGLRYDLPIGPLRVDYGFNLNRQRGEPSGSWHIGFGFAF